LKKQSVYYKKEKRKEKKKIPRAEMTVNRRFSRFSPFCSWFAGMGGSIVIGMLLLPLPQQISSVDVDATLMVVARIIVDICC